jgi:hypothetical protein
VTPDWIIAAPSALGAADMAFSEVLADIATFERLNATYMTAGTLSLGGNANTPDFLIVYDAAGQEIGRWDQYGLVVWDPANPSLAMRFRGGVLAFTSEYNAGNPDASPWSNAIGGYGIIADSITLGTAPGGHNAVPNAGFELANFTTVLTKLWDVNTDWDDATNQVFLDVSGASLTLGSAAY